MAHLGVAHLAVGQTDMARRRLHGGEGALGAPAVEIGFVGVVDGVAFGRCAHAPAIEDHQGHGLGSIRHDAASRRGPQTARRVWSCGLDANTYWRQWSIISCVVQQANRPFAA
ncbi:hypothetical protein MAIT1_00377 [Magnetofaba australis IT-1]|uniref:Uncharacterized protein n=1 Tax=Magnetofaba australis IT-1 TaxID=1434232 RepID=A0A1Y2K8J7_9PROT|nr:hypothetical protein MAIT1_00377 [Magnetofaba australis IT-1]